MTSGSVRQSVDAAKRWAEQPGQGFLLSSDPMFPAPLLEIDPVPYGLFWMGDADYLQVPGLSVVGSRNPSAYGRRVTNFLASELAAAGVQIISGMARGVDGLAHECALSAGCPTIAVLGCGLDQTYPPEHEGLKQKIAATGLLLSEYPPWVKPLPAHFPQRNRLVTGLAAGVLVTEARLRSGSLISARLAMEQGREVFAVPGSVFSRQNEGCLKLIRDGARLTTSIADIEEELPDLFRHQRAGELTGSAPRVADPVHQQLLNLLDMETRSLDFLVARTHLNVQDLLSRLVSLEISGLIESGPGGYRLARHWDSMPG
ncbi:MAG: DNA-processing protein DprA [Pseudomonadales bacterium]|nr:DNA-processing protein DprA [Pseudomonadales bacterium]